MNTYILKLRDDISLEKSSEEYINECCTYCDFVLNLIKPDMSKECSADNIEIGQEDWGWYLTYVKDNLYYNLHISFNNEAPELREFIFYSFVEKLQKKLLFSKRVELNEESSEFEKKLKPILAKYGLIVPNE